MALPRALTLLLLAVFESQVAAISLLSTLSQLAASTNASATYSVKSFANILIADTDFRALADSPIALSVFLPIDKAVQLSFISANSLPDYVKYHTVSGLIPVTAAAQGSALFFGTELRVSASSQALVKLAVSPQGVTTVSCGLGQTANVIDTVSSSNGEIFIIDQVLTPPTSVTQTIQLYGNLNKWLDVLNSAGLPLLTASNISQMTNVTLLVPNNDAITQFGLRSLGGVTFSAEYMKQIVSLHVLSGIDVSTDFDSQTGRSFPTLNPTQQLFVAPNGNGSYYFNSPNVTNTANILVSDILAAGAIIHVIDQVLTLDATVIPVVSSTMAADATTTAISISTTAMVAASTSLSTIYNINSSSIFGNLTFGNGFNSTSTNGTDGSNSDDGSGGMFNSPGYTGESQPVFPGDPNKIVWLPIVITILLSAIVTVAVWFFVVRGYKDREEADYYKEEEI